MRLPGRFFGFRLAVSERLEGIPGAKVRFAFHPGAEVVPQLPSFLCQLVSARPTSKLEHLDGVIAKVTVKADLAITTGDGPDAFAVPGAKVELKSDCAGGSYTFDTDRPGEGVRLRDEIGGFVTPTAGDKVTIVGISICQKQTVVVSDPTRTPSETDRT